MKKLFLLCSVAFIMTACTKEPEEKFTNCYLPENKGNKSCPSFEAKVPSFLDKPAECYYPENKGSKKCASYDKESSGK